MPAVKVPERKSIGPRPSEAINRLFSQVIESETFRAAPVMRTLLVYLWEHQGESVSEYAIAIDALGRQSDFDPKVDANVRVQVGRLRAKLKEGYEGELKSFPLQLSIPLGSHEIQWTYDQPATSFLAVLKEQPTSYRIALLSSIAFGLVLLAVCSGLAWENRSLKASLPVAPPQIPRLWKSFLMGGKSPLIVVPSISAFRWPDNSIVVRDTKVAEFQNWATSPFLRQMAKTWGPPIFHQDYVLGNEMATALRIQQYLETMGQRPELIESRYLPADSANTRSAIFFGGARLYSAADQVNQALAKTNFGISAEPTIVTNRNPRPGEMADYRLLDYSKEHRIVPELMILLPKTPNGGRSLLLLGASPPAFLYVLLSTDGLRRFEERLKNEGSPESWEMLIQAEVNGDTILRVDLLAMRPLPETFWK